MGLIKQMQLEAAEREINQHNRELEKWLNENGYEGWDAETYEAFIWSLEKDD